MRTKNLAVTLGCLLAALFVAGLAQAQIVNGGFETTPQSTPPAGWSWNGVSGGTATNPAGTWSGWGPFAGLRQGVVGGGAANTDVIMYQTIVLPVGGIVTGRFRYDCNDYPPYVDPGSCRYVNVSTGASTTFFGPYQCTGSSVPQIPWTQVTLALAAGTWRIECLARNAVDSVGAPYVGMDEITTGSSTCPAPTITSWTPAQGLTNSTDCCRTETFNVTLGGQLPINYSISITPPAGGSATPVPPGSTSTGSFSFTTTLCAGTNVPAAGKQFQFNVNLINCSGANNFTFQQTYTLRDTTPPVFASGGGDLFCVWPPNHNWMSTSIGTGPGQINPSGRATDNCTTSLSLAYAFLGLVSDEPANGTGDGDTDVDVGLSPDGRTAFFRAERSGGGDGRVYDVQVRATDTAGNFGAGSVGTISVPHDSSEDKDCVSSTKLGDK